MIQFCCIRGSPIKLGALTIKIISAEIGERLVETFLDARVPGAPELAGDLRGNMRW